MRPNAGRSMPEVPVCFAADADDDHMFRPLARQPTPGMDEQGNMSEEDTCRAGGEVPR